MFTKSPRLPPSASLFHPSSFFCYTPRRSFLRDTQEKSPRLARCPLGRGKLLETTPVLRGLFRTKNLDDILAAAGGPQFSLKRTLGAFNVTLLGIGAIIGAGIFATVGTAAAGDASRPGAGPSLMLSFVITAIVCAFTALCYAEFASMVPISGSAYTYSYATLGELVAWIIGWDLIIEYAVGNIAVAISWANYFRTLLDNVFESLGSTARVPLWLATDYRTAMRLAESNPQ